MHWQTWQDFTTLYCKMIALFQYKATYTATLCFSPYMKRHISRYFIYIIMLVWILFTFMRFLDYRHTKKEVKKHIKRTDIHRAFWFSLGHAHGWNKSRNCHRSFVNHWLQKMTMLFPFEILIWWTKNLWLHGSCVISPFLGCGQNSRHVNLRKKSKQSSEQLPLKNKQDKHPMVLFWWISPIYSITILGELVRFTCTITKSPYLNRYNIYICFCFSQIWNIQYHSQEKEKTQNPLSPPWRMGHPIPVRRPGFFHHVFSGHPCLPPLWHRAIEGPKTSSIFQRYVLSSMTHGT